jgi:pimeloyl-ACP methyl ester carboxylesterase
MSDGLRRTGVRRVVHRLRFEGDRCRRVWHDWPVTGDPTSTDATFASLDGLRLSGTLVTGSGGVLSVCVLVHGGGVTRNEGGFFERMAGGLAEAGVASLRFDLRGHGESEGRQEDLTIAGISNDIRAAVEYVRSATGCDAAVNVVGASFSGGISAFFSARHPDLVRRLVLLNPLLNYKKRFIDDKPYWHADHIDEKAAQELTQNGFLPHSPTFRLGRPLLNEVFYLEPHKVLAAIHAPTLFVHGTGDTFVPIESSRIAVRQISADAHLMEVDGAQHGFAVHEDPQYLDPQTQRWQADVIRAVVEWLS